MKPISASHRSVQERFLVLMAQILAPYFDFFFGCDALIDAEEPYTVVRQERPWIGARVLSFFSGRAARIQKSTNDENFTEEVVPLNTTPGEFFYSLVKKNDLDTTYRVLDPGQLSWTERISRSMRIEDRQGARDPILWTVSQFIAVLAGISYGLTAGGTMFLLLQAWPLAISLGVGLFISTHTAYMNILLSLAYVPRSFINLLNPWNFHRRILRINADDVQRQVEEYQFQSVSQVSQIELKSLRDRILRFECEYAANASWGELQSDVAASYMGSSQDLLGLQRLSIKTAIMKLRSKAHNSQEVLNQSYDSLAQSGWQMLMEMNITNSEESIDSLTPNQAKQILAKFRESISWVKRWGVIYPSILFASAAAVMTGVIAYFSTQGMIAKIFLLLGVPIGSAGLAGIATVLGAMIACMVFSVLFTNVCDRIKGVYWSEIKKYFKLATWKEILDKTTVKDMLLGVLAGMVYALCLWGVITYFMKSQLGFDRVLREQWMVTTDVSLTISSIVAYVMAVPIQTFLFLRTARDTLFGSHHVVQHEVPSTSSVIDNIKAIYRGTTWKEFLQLGILELAVSPLILFSTMLKMTWDLLTYSRLWKAVGSGGISFAGYGDVATRYDLPQGDIAKGVAGVASWFNAYFVLHDVSGNQQIPTPSQQVLSQAITAARTNYRDTIWAAPKKLEEMDYMPPVESSYPKI